MILVTHDLGVVANRTDEIAVMYAGQVVEQAPTATLFRDMRHPYTEALLGSIPRLEYPSHTPLQTIPGRPPDLAAAPPGCRFAPRCRYAQDRCLEEPPPLVPTDRLADTPAGDAGASAGPGTHLHRCFFPIGTDAGRDALARNVAAGRTAAGMALTPAGTADVVGAVSAVGGASANGQRDAPEAPVTATAGGAEEAPGGTADEKVKG
jgi:peptide/nickel transport system ATP-binding protein